MIDFKIVTPYGITFEDKIEGITIPTQGGVITVLENHIPLMSLLTPGELIIYKKYPRPEAEDQTSIAVSTGFVEVQKNSKVYILADTAEREEEIDIQRAEEAREKALNLLEEKEVLGVADVDFAKLQAIIERETARIQVGKKYRKLRIE